jgi:hypothetical protein
VLGGSRRYRNGARYQEHRSPHHEGDWRNRWRGLEIGEIVALDHIAHAHELVEHPATPGRVIVTIT